LFKENTMKLTTQLAAAAIALVTTFAAGGAFASEGDAQPDNAWLAKTAISTPAPAPVATAGQTKDADQTSSVHQSRDSGFNQQAVTP
jgi:hypothetical protein